MKRHCVDKRKYRTHQYGRKKKQYKGRKERLRSQNEELKKAVESAQQEQNKLETKANEFLKETVRLRRLVVVVYYTADGLGVGPSWVGYVCIL